jgi:hypothetical protein
VRGGRSAGASPHKQQQQQQQHQQQQQQRQVPLQTYHHVSVDSPGSTVFVHEHLKHVGGDGVGVGVGVGGDERSLSGRKYAATPQNSQHGGNARTAATAAAAAAGVVVRGSGKHSKTPPPTPLDQQHGGGRAFDWSDAAVASSNYRNSSSASSSSSSSSSSMQPQEVSVAIEYEYVAVAPTSSSSAAAAASSSSTTVVGMCDLSYTRCDEHGVVVTEDARGFRVADDDDADDSRSGNSSNSFKSKKGGSNQATQQQQQQHVAQRMYVGGVVDDVCIRYNLSSRPSLTIWTCAMLMLLAVITRVCDDSTFMILMATMCVCICVLLHGTVTGGSPLRLALLLTMAVNDTCVSQHKANGIAIDRHVANREAAKIQLEADALAERRRVDREKAKAVRSKRTKSTTGSSINGKKNSSNKRKSVGKKKQKGKGKK